MPSFLTPNRHPYSVQFSPHQENCIAVATSQFYGFAGGGTLFILDLVDEAYDLSLVQRKSLEWTDGLFDVTWLPHPYVDMVMSASGDGSLQLWNTGDNGKDPVTTFSEHQQEIYSVHWSKRDSSFLSSSWDTTIKLWDVTRQQSLHTYSGHEDMVFCATFSPFAAKTFASVSCDGTLKLWDKLMPRAIMTVKDVDNSELLTCDWSNLDGNLVVAGSSEGSIKGFDIRKMTKAAFELDGFESAVRRVKFAPDAPYKLAAVSFDQTTRIWDDVISCSEEADAVFSNHSEFAYGLDWNPFASQLVDCGWDSIVKMFTYP